MTDMKKLKILFQGDSITEDNRLHTKSGLGLGYVQFAAMMLSKKYPAVEFEFVNRGIVGNQTADLLARVDEDIVAVDPDVISILIGANDVWHIKKDEKEYLVPAIPDVIVSVNINTDTIVIRPLKGIFDDED